MEVFGHLGQQLAETLGADTYRLFRFRLLELLGAVVDDRPRAVVAREATRRVRVRCSIAPGTLGGVTRRQDVLVAEPRASRPHMPGYGIADATEGRGLLPWSWAETRLIASHDYWVATVWPDGRPHVMPVWGLWRGDAFWFSTSVRARKARNLAEDPRCVVTTEDPQEPVVVEGVAEVVTDLGAIEATVHALNDKYSSDLTVDFLAPDVNATIRVGPRWAFGLVDAAFTATPTRWEF